jgi:hypothetical protein
MSHNQPKYGRETISGHIPAPSVTPNVWAHAKPPGKWRRHHNGTTVQSPISPRLTNRSVGTAHTSGNKDQKKRKGYHATKNERLSCVIRRACACQCWRAAGNNLAISRQRSTSHIRVHPCRLTRVFNVFTNVTGDHIIRSSTSQEHEYACYWNRHAQAEASLIKPRINQSITLSI